MSGPKGAFSLPSETPACCLSFWEWTAHVGPWLACLPSQDSGAGGLYRVLRLQGG